MTIKKSGHLLQKLFKQEESKNSSLTFVKTKFGSSGELAAVDPKNPNESVWIRDESSDCRKETSDSGEHPQP